MCFFLVATLVPVVAAAHASYSPMRTNRYVKISLVGGGAIRVAWSVMYGDGPAAAVRRAADVDRSGVLDDREIERLSRDVAAAVAEGLQIEVDGEPRRPSWEAPIASIGSAGSNGGGDARVGPLAFSIDLAGRLDVSGPGPHVVKLDDTTSLDQLGETELRVEEGPGTQVLQGWRARDDGGRVLRFVFDGPKYSLLEDRSIGFRFVEKRPPRRARALPIALAGALVAVIVAAVLLRRRARA